MKTTTTKTETNDKDIIVSFVFALNVLIYGDISKEMQDNIEILKHKSITTEIDFEPKPNVKYDVVVTSMEMHDIAIQYVAEDGHLILDK